MHGIIDRPGYPGRSMRARRSAFRSLSGARGFRIAAAALVAAFLVTGCDAKPTSRTTALPSVPAGTQVLAGFAGTTTYHDLLDFVGAAGSPITGAPNGFRQVGSISAADGQDGWLALTLERPNVAAACGTQHGEAFLAWPGGWLPVGAAGTRG
jgi:hypothetical protein